MTPTAIVLIAVVWAVVVLAVAVWRIRRRVILLDDMATRTAHNLISAESNLSIDIHELQDSRSRTADLDVPTIHRPIPPDFNRNR
ncbi:hypothetical protein [Corynebacterium sp.]|uniref:hypothetical protein n=1 Tax=Corynebacterium sp. TaxID=1720 RepID=UPI0028AC851B|nr:hypothetical protein [Corynebacterium sp.]